MVALQVWLIRALLLMVVPISVADYQYPIKSAFLATVAGTPSDFQADLGKGDILETVLEIQPSPGALGVPSLFSGVERAAFKLAWQDAKAPLVFIIAGTGARYDASKVEYLKTVFYRAGYHVVQLSSPTSFDFIVNTSETHRPGISRKDAGDLYRLMQASLERIRRFRPLLISGYSLTGYSLGALDAAFVGFQDDRQRKIGFERILLMNPPVYLKTSVDNLDRLMLARVPGVKDSSSLFEHFFSKLANYFRVHKSMDLDMSLLLDIQKEGEGLSEQELALLIGMAFRFSVASMVFTSDVMTQSGLIVPQGFSIKDTDSRTPYLRSAMHFSFNRYLKKMLLPFLNQKNAGHQTGFTSADQALSENSLTVLRRWLSRTEKIGVMHNANDIILDQKGLTFLYDTFGSRARIYPLGGHMGNLQFRTNVSDMMSFMKTGSFPDA